MLSTTTYLLLGNEIISSLVLTHLVSMKSKFHHGLVYSDVKPRDRQNYRSCQKICKENVLQVLETLFEDIPGTKAMYVYLKLIQSVMIAYCEKKTLLIDRLYYAWLSVFISRFWLAWLSVQSKDELINEYSNKFPSLSAIISDEWRKKVTIPDFAKMKTKQQFTISYPSYFSIEINAHSLTCLTLLAIDGQIPFNCLSIDRCNSQTCEQFFRSARAMSGVSSTIVNFTVCDLLRRADKINSIQSIKLENESNTSGPSIHFPRHHKHGKFTGNINMNYVDTSIKQSDIEHVVHQAFIAAYDLIKIIIDENLLKKNKYNTILGLSKFSAELLHSLMIKVKSSQSQQTDGDQSDELGNEVNGNNEEDEEVNGNNGEDEEVNGNNEKDEEVYDDNDNDVQDNNEDIEVCIKNTAKKYVKREYEI